MKPNTPLEDRLDAIGSALRARPSLSDRVMAEVRRSAVEGATQEATEEASTLKPRASFGRRWQLVTAAVATIAVALLIAVVLSPSPSVGWEDVAKTIQSQKWIRGTASHRDGRRGIMWLSPQRKVWARTSGTSSFYFSDGRERAKYQYYRGARRIIRYPLGEDDAQRVLPIDALSQDKSTIGPWLFGEEKVFNQRRREITEAGKTWIEFQLAFALGGGNRRATLRVDPETRLPVYLLCISREDPKDSFKWQFDYPAEGPTDIYALGVPREIEIDDRMPSQEALRVLDGIAAGRARLGDFRLTVAHSAAGQDDGRTLVVWRKGDRWRVDRCLGSDLPKPADGQDLGDWFAERVKRSEQIPLYICDGKTVYRNHPRSRSDGKAIRWQTGRAHAPQDLMSGLGVYSNLTYAPYVKLVPLVYPDLTPDPNAPFELDPQPANFPGCVLIKRSTLLTDGSLAHHWCYIDPSKGHAVVRAAVFTLPPDRPASPEASSDCHSVLMEGFQRSPRGFWYPTVVHNTLEGVRTTVRYRFDFEAHLPDSLFTIDGAQARKR